MTGRQDVRRPIPTAVSPPTAVIPSYRRDPRLRAGHLHRSHRSCRGARRARAVVPAGSEQWVPAVAGMTPVEVGPVRGAGCPVAPHGEPVEPGGAWRPGGVPGLV